MPFTTVDALFASRLTSSPALTGEDAWWSSMAHRSRRY